MSIALTTTHLDSFFATALAKRLAVLHGVDLAKITGTGPDDSDIAWDPDGAQEGDEFDAATDAEAEGEAGSEPADADSKRAD